MKICGLEKFSLVDYDDYVTCTVFTKGCNFLCPFCHNSSLVLADHYADAIDEDVVFDYLTKRSKMVDAVCITGGEPTLQPDLVDFIKKVKDMGFKVKLDSNGTKPSLIGRLIEDKLIDYVAMDIKNSLEKYPLTSGVDGLDVAPILESIKIIKSTPNHEFRTTLIKEHHTKEDIEKIADLVSGAKNYMLQKFKDNGECISHGLTEVDKDVAEKYLEIVKPYVQTAKLRGY